MKRSQLAALEGHPVRVVWQDATAPSPGWQSVEDLAAEELATVVTVGHLVKVSRHSLHVALDRNSHGDVASTGLIPLGWILSAERLVVDKYPLAEFH